MHLSCILFEARQTTAKKKHAPQLNPSIVLRAFLAFLHALEAHYSKASNLENQLTSSTNCPLNPVYLLIKQFIRSSVNLLNLKQ